MINELTFQIHNGGLGGGIAATVGALLEFIESLMGKTPPEIFAILMPGIHFLDDLHPLFVHYPIALFSLFFLVDLTGALAKKPQWRYVAGWLLYLATVFAAFTVIAGLFAADSVEHDDVVHEIMERHEHFGIAVLAMGLFLSGWRLQQWGLKSVTGNALFLSLAGLLCLVLTMGADLGGLMVYQYGVAVNSTENALSTTEDSHQEEHNVAKSALVQPDAAKPSEAEPQHSGHHHGKHHHHGGHHH